MEDSDVTEDTSSDSELESKLKVQVSNRSEENNENCLICKKSTGTLINGKVSSMNRLVDCFKSRETITKNIDHDFYKTLLTIQNGNELNKVVWHHSCYSSYTSSKNIDKLRCRFEREKKKGDVVQCSEEPSASTVISTRKVAFQVEKCLFCQKRSNKKKLIQVLTTNTDKKIKIMAKQNLDLLERIGSDDTIAMEVKYHASCFNMEWKKCKLIPTGRKTKSKKEDRAFAKLVQELKIGLNKGKGFGTSSVYDRYLKLNGDKSKKYVINRVKDWFGDEIQVVKSQISNESDMIILSRVFQEDMIPTYEEQNSKHDGSVYTALSEPSVLHKICNDIRTEISQMPQFKEYKNLDINSYESKIPKSLIWLLTLLVSNQQNTNKNEVLSICQDIIYASSNHKQLTPKHIGLGLMIHQETRSKKILESLHNCGHCVSYVDVLRLRNTIAQEEISKYVENDNTVIPRQLVPNRFVQFAADNIDILEETLDKSPTFHGTQMIAFQQGPPKEEINREFELLPYRVKLNIPDNFHLLRKINFSKVTRISSPPVGNKDAMFTTECDESYIRQHNMSWALCRMTDTQSNKERFAIPQWSGFNKILIEDECDTTSYGHLPLLPYVASDYDTVWTTMKRCEAIANHLNIEHTVVTFDQAIYYKAKEIQWLKPKECEKFIVRLGGFHIMLNFLHVIGQHMENFGLSDVWLESGLYGESTVAGIMNGKKWNKSIRAHKLTYESLMRILLPMFEKWLTDCKSDDIHYLNFARLMSKELCKDIREKRRQPLETFKKIVATFAGFQETFTDFINSQSPTFRYWCTYLNLVEILLEFLYSERTGNWELHLNSFRKMMPWFFAYDHTNYSRWGSIYLLDMMDLATKAPEVYNEFLNGNFVIKRLKGKFNTISVDQALEHVNKMSKEAGGIVGLTRNSTKMDEWFLSFNEIGLMVENFKESIKTVTDPVSQNIEVGSQRMVVDEDSVVRLLEQFNRFKVFDRHEENIIVISTNEILSKSATEIVSNTLVQGENALKKFVVVIDTSDFYKPIKKLNLLKLKLSITKSKSEKTKTDKGNNWQQGQEFLQRLLAAKEMGREIGYNQIFQHELTPYPMALTTNGNLSTPSNKSSLGTIIESYTSSTKILPENEASKTCHIFDGMSIVQALGKPAKVKTFGEYAQAYAGIIFKNKINAQRIDLVLDHYQETSIKSCTRTKRGSEKTINRIIDDINAPLPQQWHLFIHSTSNKKQLTNFLSQQMISFSKGANVKFVTSGGFDDILKYEANFPLHTDLLAATHEEADTRILLHILSAKNEGYQRCIIDCKDTDVLVLLSHFKEHLTPEIWMKVGTQDMTRYISVHGLNMNPLLLKNLPAFHALTGSDTTSQFNGLGKRSCWKIYIDNCDLLNEVGIGEFNDNTFSKMHNFVLSLYTSNKDIFCLNELRGILAVSKTIDKLPPTKDALLQHCLRAHYQSKVWYNSIIPKPTLPDITQCGWKIEEDRVLPILQTCATLPEDLTILSTCGCKKDCIRKWCSCRRNNICCIGSCKCMGQKSCSNNREIRKPLPEPVMIGHEGSDSD